MSGVTMLEQKSSYHGDIKMSKQYVAALHVKCQYEATMPVMKDLKMAFLRQVILVELIVMACCDM